MKLRLWPRRRPPEPAGEGPATDAALEEEPPPPPDPPPAPEPPDEAPATDAALREEPPPPPARPPAPEPERPPPAARRPGRPASAFARPYAPETEEEEDTAPVPPAEPPATVSLTVEEAKTAVRAAGGDVIQIGFLANAYRRQRAEEPASKETAAARVRLSELVAKRLKDRKLLAPEGRLELLEEPPPR